VVSAIIQFSGVCGTRDLVRARAALDLVGAAQRLRLQPERRAVERSAASSLRVNRLKPVP
jgi:hypothetical protein